MRNFDFVGNQILLRILLVSVISFLVVSLGAQNLKAAPFTGNYLWSLEGQQVEEQDVLSSSTLTSFSVVANLKNKLTNNFFLHFSPGVFFTSARAQDLVLYKRPSNSFFANQAKMSFRPLYALQLQAGAIKMDMRIVQTFSTIKVMRKERICSKFSITSVTWEVLLYRLAFLRFHQSTAP